MFSHSENDVVTMMFASQMMFCQRQNYGVSLGRNGFETPHPLAERHTGRSLHCIEMFCKAERCGREALA